MGWWLAMQRLGEQPSWRISIDPWSELYDVALWFRAAERVDVPAGGTVPGPLDIDPLPEPTAGLHEDLTEGWLGWWQVLTGQPRWPTGRFADLAAERAVTAGPPPALVQFSPPDFPGLAGWATLRRVVAQRWPEAHQWHNRRKTAGLNALRSNRRLPVESHLVAEVERALGRRVPAFDIEFVVVPAHDTQIRQLTDTRYLVPESVYDTSAWTDWLRTLILRLAR